MKKLILALCLLLPLVSFGQQADTTSINDTTPQVYIPKDLEDCMRQLDSMLNAEDKAYIQKEGAAAVHFSLGMWIRNNWGLWGSSRLQKYFVDNGIKHPDDMSEVILGCYVKHLNGEELDFKHVKRMLRDIRRETEKWKKEILKQQKQKQKR